MAKNYKTNVSDRNDVLEGCQKESGQSKLLLMGGKQIDATTVNRGNCLCSSFAAMCHSFFHHHTHAAWQKNL
jgi:hypothetical protein